MEQAGEVRTPRMDGPGGKLAPLGWGLCALLTAFALSVDLSALPLQLPGGEGWVAGLASALFALTGAAEGEGPVFLVLVPALLLLYRRLWREALPILPSGAAVAALFALFLLAGQCYALADSWDPLLANPLCRTVALAMLLGYWVCFYLLTAALFRALDRRAGERPAPLDRRGRRRRSLLALGILAVCWLPYLVLCWPGSLTYDAQWQLGQYFGQTAATNHHPWLSTLLMGGLVDLGGSLEWGLFRYVLFQSTLCAAVFAAVCVQAGELAGRRAFWLSLA